MPITPKKLIKRSKPTVVNKIGGKTMLKYNAIEEKAITSSLADLLVESVKASGQKLTADQLKKLKTDILNGLQIAVNPIGPLAQVSGNVAGSLTVDW